jgi:hypothetical protein
MTAAQLDRTPMGTEVTFVSGRMKGQLGTVVDVRHEGHHVRVALADGRTVSTRPGAIKRTGWSAFDNGGWEGADDDDPRYASDPNF